MKTTKQLAFLLTVVLMLASVFAVCNAATVEIATTDGAGGKSGAALTVPFKVTV